MGEMTATDFEGFPPVACRKKDCGSHSGCSFENCHVSVQVFLLTSVKAIFQTFGWRESFEGKEKMRMDIWGLYVASMRR